MFSPRYCLGLVCLLLLHVSSPFLHSRPPASRRFQTRMRILVVGESVIDRVISPAGDVNDVLGGSSSNTVVALALAGVPTSFLGRFGTDKEGDLLRERKVKAGVDVSLSLQSSAEPSSIVTVTIDSSGLPSYSFGLEGAVDFEWKTHELPSIETCKERGIRIVHFGSLASYLEPGGPVLLNWAKRLRSEGITVSYDPNVRPAAARDPSHADEIRQIINDFVASSNLVKVSEEDLEWMSNDPWHKVGETWSMRGPELVVVTRGGDGVAAFKGGKQLTALPSVPVELVDTVGAGDTYMAWLLAGALNGDLEDAALHKTLSLAAKAAAINCSRKGCQPPRQSEVLP